MTRKLLVSILSLFLACSPAVAASGSGAPPAPILPDQAKLIAPQARSYDAFGDSITAGYAASAPANNYVSLLGAALGVAPVNHGVSGSEIGDQQSAIYAAAPNDTGSQLYTYMIGTNDGTFIGTTSASVQTWETVYSAELAWLALPARAKQLGQSAGVTYGGSGGSHWSNAAEWGGAFSKKTNTNGDTATFSVYGDTFYVAYGLDSVNTGGTFTVSVDGTQYGGTYATAGAGAALVPARLGATHASALLRIAGQSRALHTVVVTVTSATSASNVVWLDWIGQPSNSYFPFGPTVVAASPIQNLGASAASIQAYALYEQRSIQALVGDGLNIAYVDPSGYVLNPVDYYFTTLTNAAISGTTLTFASSSGQASAVGMTVYGPGVTAGTTISSGSGLSWTVNNSQTVATTTLYLGDSTHPGDAGETHLRDAFLAALTASTTARQRSAGQAPSAPVVRVPILAGCGSYLLNTGVGNSIFGGGWSNFGTCLANYMTGSGHDNTIAGGWGNSIGGGGVNNTNGNIIGAGSQNSAQFGGQNGILAGTLNLAQGFYNFDGAGQNNKVTGKWSSISSGAYGDDRGRYGVDVFGSPYASVNGAGQRMSTVLAARATSTTAVRLTFDGAAAGAANCVNIPTNAAFQLRVDVVALDRTTPANNESWAQWSMLMTRGAANAALSAAATPTPTTNGTVTGSSISATADTTNQCLNLSFTPPTGNTDTWDIAASITGVEVQ